MRVRMIDSLHGVRRRRRPWGLNAIPTDRRDAAEQALDDATAPLFDVFERLQAKTGEGALPLYEATRLENAYYTLQNRIAEHMATLSSIETDRDFAAWTVTADQLAQEASTLTAEIGSTIGFEESTKPLRLVVFFGGAVLLLGGLAWVIAKKGQRG
jgi:hypothetical protein